MLTRNNIDPLVVDVTLGNIKRKLEERLNQKGRRQFINLHEAWGILDEEVREFKDAVHSKDTEQATQELLDIAVACVAALSSEIF